MACNWNPTLKYILLPLVFISFFAITGCDNGGGGGDNSDGVEQDLTEEPGDGVDEVEAATAFVRLTILGNLETEWFIAEDRCRATAPATEEEGVFITEGRYDLDVYNLGEQNLGEQRNYRLHLWVKAEKVGQGDVDPTVQLSHWEIRFQQPTIWNGAVLPAVTVNAEETMQVGTTSVFEVGVFDDAVVNVINELYNTNAADPSDSSTRLGVDVQMVAFVSGLGEVRSSSFIFPIKPFCRRCLLSMNPGNCCISDVDPAATQRVTDFHQHMSFIHSAGQCELYQDNTLGTYCSWLYDCYHEVMDCPAVSCDK